MGAPCNRDQYIIIRFTNTSHAYKCIRVINPLFMTLFFFVFFFFQLVIFLSPFPYFFVLFLFFIPQWIYIVNVANQIFVLFLLTIICNSNVASISTIIILLLATIYRSISFISRICARSVCDFNQLIHMFFFCKNQSFLDYHLTMVFDF